MAESNMEKPKLVKNKGVPLNLLFHEDCYYLNKQKESKKIPELNLKNDVLINLMKIIKSINFTGISSLIEYCKVNSFIELQLVFEWINHFNNSKDEVFKRKNIIFGIIDMIDEFKNDHEETKIKYEYKFYTSKIRKTLLDLIENFQANLFKNKSTYSCLLNNYILSVLNLNFKDSIDIIREIISTNKVSNEMLPILLALEELSKNYNEFKYLNNDFIVNMLNLALEKITMDDDIKLIILFLLRKIKGIPQLMFSNEILILIKLNFMLKYSTKDEIIEYLFQLKEMYLTKGLLEGLILLGSSEESSTLLDNFLDKTDDILICYILKMIFCNKYPKATCKVELELFDCLNRLKKWNERIILCQKVRELSNTTVVQKPNLEYILTCFFCGMKIQEKNEQLRSILFMNNKDTQFIDFCPKCNKKFPSCAICLYPIELSFPTNNLHKQRNSTPRLITEYGSRKTESFDDSVYGVIQHQDLKFMWCVKCKHGGHINHIKKWFEELLICPVADCNCFCSENNHIVI